MGSSVHSPQNPHLSGRSNACTIPDREPSRARNGWYTPHVEAFGIYRGRAKVGVGLMILTNLQGVAELVVRRAQRQGFIVPREVREELNRAGVPSELWKDVVALGRA